jgi:hypothetical protein
VPTACGCWEVLAGSDDRKVVISYEIAPASSNQKTKLSEYVQVAPALTAVVSFA